MTNHRVAPELEERAIMYLMPPRSLRKVADDIGVGIATVHGWHKQLKLEGLIVRKVEPGVEHSAEQIFTILPEITSSIQCHIPLQYRQLLILNKIALYSCYRNIIASDNIGQFTLKQPMTL